MPFVRQTLPTQHYLYVDRECPYGPEIADAMGSAFGEVFSFLGQSGITPLSMPMSVYTEMDPEVLRFRGGAIVAENDAGKATGPVKADTLPGGEVMHTVHVGTYDTLNETHRALWAHMEAEGIPASMPIWEIFVDDPQDTAPERLQTEIFRAIG